jgi:hypothetical protein
MATPLDHDVGQGELRQRHGSVQLTDENGRRRTVQLDELNAADRELAEKFGYKPVWVPNNKFFESQNLTKL